MIKEKERKLEEIEKKFELTQELLTNNWHKAMAEVRRQYDSIDSALEVIFNSLFCCWKNNVSPIKC